MNKYQEALDKLVPCHNTCDNFDKDGKLDCNNCGIKELKETLQELIDIYNRLTEYEIERTVNKIIQTYNFEIDEPKDVISNISFDFNDLKNTLDNIEKNYREKYFKGKDNE